MKIFLKKSAIECADGVLNLTLQVTTASSRFLKSLIKRSKLGKCDHILPQKIATY